MNVKHKNNTSGNEIARKSTAKDIRILKEIEDRNSKLIPQLHKRNNRFTKIKLPRRLRRTWKNHSRRRPETKPAEKS